jgi:hypothetical protein
MNPQREVFDAFGTIGTVGTMGPGERRGGLRPTLPAVSQTNQPPFAFRGVARLI